MQCPSIKSPPLWYGSGFFFKIRYYYAFVTKEILKTHFLNGISSQKIILKFFVDLIDVYQYHTP